MIEQIQKFQKGGTSRQRLQDEEAAYRAAYANAGEDAKKEADALIQSMSNYSSANPMVGRRNRENQARIYQEATRILTGGERTAPSIAGSGADYVINAFYNANKTRSGVPASGSAAQTPSAYTTYRNYKWSDGLDVVAQDEDLNAKVVRLANTLASNLDGVFNAWNQNEVVRGMDKSRKGDLEIVQGRLRQIAEGVSNGNMDARAAQAEILKNAQLLGIKDQNIWDSYFGETDDLSEADKNFNKLKGLGYTFADTHSNSGFANYLKTKGYRIGKDRQGNEYLYDKNYNLVTNNNDVFIDSDYFGSEYGTGYAIGSDGRFHFSDNMFALDKSSPYYQQVRKYIENLQKDNKEAFVYSKNLFDQNTSLSNSELLNRNSSFFHGKRILDLSRYFGGKEVVATVRGNDFTTVIDPNTGAIDLRNPSLQLHIDDGNGGRLDGSYNDLKQLLGDVDFTGSGVASLNLSQWRDPQVNLDALELSDMTQDLAGKEFWWGWGNARRNNNNWEGNEFDIRGQRDLQKQTEEAAKYLVYLWGNKSNGKLNNVQHRDYARWFGSDQATLQALAIINKALNENPQLFNTANSAETSEKYKQTWQAMLTAYRNKLSSQQATQDVAVNKKGGMLFAKEGTVLDIVGNEASLPGYGTGYAAEVRRKASTEAVAENKLQEEAARFGRTKTQHVVGQRWTPQDTLRATSLLTDIGGLIAAATGGATMGTGNAIAVGAGAVSTVMDTIADFTDDSVSKGQAWKNLGLNLGFTAAAAVGGNAPRIVKSALRLVPKIMMYAGAAGIVFDKEVHNTISKMSSGEKLNVSDWRNIMQVLRIGTGMASAGVAKRNVRKGQEVGEATVKKHKEALLAESAIDPNIKYVGLKDGAEAIPIPKTIYDDVNAKLKSGKKEDVDSAMELLTRAADDPDTPGAGLSQKDAAGIIEAVAGDKKGIKDRILFWKNAEDNTVKQLRDASTEQIDALLGSDISAQARLNAIAELRQTARQGRPDWWVRLEDRAEGMNPALNAVLGGTNYKNISELIAEENKKLGAFTPNAGKNMDFTPLSEAEVLAQRKGVRAGILADADVKAKQDALDAAGDALSAARRDNSQVRRAQDLQRRFDRHNESALKNLPTVEDLEANIRAAEQRKAEFSTGLDAVRLEQANKAAYDRVQEARRLGQEITPEMLRAERSYLEARTKGTSFSELPKEIQQIESDIQRSKDAIAHMEATVGGTPEGRRIIRGLKALVKRKTEAEKKIVQLKESHPEYFTPSGNLKKEARRLPEVKALLDEVNNIKKQIKNASRKTGAKAWLKGTEAQRELKRLEKLWDSKMQQLIDADDYLRSRKTTSESNAESISNLERNLADADSDITKAKLALESRNKRAAEIEARIARRREMMQKIVDNAEASRDSAISTAERTRTAAKKELMSELTDKRSRLLSRSSVDLGSSSKEVTFKAGDTEVTAPSGTRAVSYHKISDLETAKQVVKTTRPDIVEIPKSEWKKIIPSNILSKVRGVAYDPTAKEFVILEHGGQIQHKYSHLRK